MFEGHTSYAVDVLFEISFGIPNKRAACYVREAVGGAERAAKDPRPEFRAVGIRCHNIVYEVVAYSRGVQKDPQIRLDIIFRIQEIFQTEGHMSFVD